MKITVPREKKKVIEFLERSDYKRISSDEKTVTYEGAFPLAFPFKELNIPTGEREAFRRKLKVEGGYKTRLGDRVDVTPYRNDWLRVRISKEMHELIKEYAKEHESSVSNFVRLAVLDKIDRWLQAKRRSEEFEEAEEKAAEEETREEERMYG